MFIGELKEETSPLSASICGLYFSHPDSYRFGVGRIERGQIEH